tara:strand:+ start:542 stop:925 length:384 start_codon:yes stop_codon:yes gene_type:complete
VNIKSSKTLVEEALKEIKTLNANEVKELHIKNQCNLIDIRDIRELERDGRIENSKHVPRGMIEFWLDPNSPYFKENKIDTSKELVLFCAGGLRSALAAKTLKDMGFKKVSHIEGGFSSMKLSGFKII